MIDVVPDTHQSWPLLLQRFFLLLSCHAMPSIARTLLPCRLAALAEIVPPQTLCILAPPVQLLQRRRRSCKPFSGPSPGSVE